MKLVSVKLEKKELEERNKPMESALSDQPIYPWGLSVRLEDNTLDKLGMTELPKVGTVMTLIARVSVTSVSSNENIGGGKGKHEHRSVELQITDLALDETDDGKDAAAELYEKG